MNGLIDPVDRQTLALHSLGKLLHHCQHRNPSCCPPLNGINDYFPFRKLSDVIAVPATSPSRMVLVEVGNRWHCTDFFVPLAPDISHCAEIPVAHIELSLGLRGHRRNWHAAGGCASGCRRKIRDHGWRRRRRRQRRRRRRRRQG